MNHKMYLKVYKNSLLNITTSYIIQTFKAIYGNSNRSIIALGIACIFDERIIAIFSKFRKWHEFQ